MSSSEWNRLTATWHNFPSWAKAVLITVVVVTVAVALFALTAVLGWQAYFGDTPF
jgi:hypothetical protein